MILTIAEPISQSETKQWFYYWLQKPSPKCIYVFVGNFYKLFVGNFFFHYVGNFYKLLWAYNFFIKFVNTHTSGKGFCNQ